MNMLGLVSCNRECSTSGDFCKLESDNSSALQGSKDKVSRNNGDNHFSENGMVSSTDLPKNFAKRHNFTCAIEGNIGCGKTTLLSYFLDTHNVEVFPEPVNAWKDINGHNALDLMYKDATRWSLAFQSYAQLTMLDIQSKKQKAPVRLIERSVHSGRYCFIENLRSANVMPEVDYAVLCEWYDWICNSYDVSVDQIIYLKTDPLVCAERIKTRDRTEECSIPIDYLTQLHNLHENWLVKKKFGEIAPILILDGNKSINCLRRDLEQRTKEILCGFC